MPVEHVKTLAPGLPGLGDPARIEALERTGLLGEGADATLCLDGDNAGRRATLAAVEQLWRRGHRVNVAALPDGLDPLELLRSAAL